MNKEYERKHKEDKPVLAICYDFDKTLSPDDMQAQGYIQAVGYDVSDFWKTSNKLASDNDMDQNLAYMYKMIQEADGRIKEKLQEYGDYSGAAEPPVRFALSHHSGKTEPAVLCRERLFT